MGGIVIGSKVIWDGTNGGRLGIWSAHVKAAERIIAQHKLQPIRVKTEVVGEIVRGGVKKLPIRLPRIPFPGIPVPHIHSGGKIYPVSDVQWKQFVDGVVREVQVRLSEAKQVDPSTLAALSDLTSQVR